MEDGYDSLEPSFTSPEPLDASGGDIDALCQTYFTNVDFYSTEYNYPQKTMEANTWRAGVSIL